MKTHNSPDFMIIGAMKSATSTLHEQLAMQKGVYMSTPKEPNFFSNDEIYTRGLSWYKNLFTEAADSDLCGESSTHYTKLPTYPKTIARIQENLSGTKFIYVIRHPIDRLISHYIHEWSQNVIRCDINSAIDRHPELIEYGLYHKQIAPFIKSFGRDAVLIIYFQQIIQNPQQALEQVCQHIGYKDKPSWVVKQKPQNVSSERIRRFPFYHVLVESKLATALRQNFLPRKVRDTIKAKFSMSDRPTLNDSNFTQLEKVFDKDLEYFSSLIGEELKCANFNKQLSSST